VGTARFGGDGTACETVVDTAPASYPDVLFAAVLTPDTIACVEHHTRTASPTTRVRAVARSEDRPDPVSGSPVPKAL